jgi:excisionase family DNA binding protein
MTDTEITPKWYTTAQVAQLLGYGLTKTKYLVTTGQIRSVKDGRHRRILPEWVDEYIRRVVEGDAA